MKTTAILHLHEQLQVYLQILIKSPCPCKNLSCTSHQFLIGTVYQYGFLSVSLICQVKLFIHKVQNIQYTKCLHWASRLGLCLLYLLLKSSNENLIICVKSWNLPQPCLSAKAFFCFPKCSITSATHQYWVPYSLSLMDCLCDKELCGTYS